MKKRIIYIGLLSLIVIFISIAYFSYAFFIRDYEYHGKLNIVAGTLNYEIRSNDLDNGSISIPKNSSKEIVIDVKSLNDVNSLFELYYNADSSVGVGYIIENIESQPTGQINSRETKVIKVKITNTSSSAKTVTFGVNGGLVGQTLTLGNLGSSIDIGDVKTAIVAFSSNNQKEAVACTKNNEVYTECEAYTTLELALASRNASTIILMKNATKSEIIEISSAKDITLNLNGKTITNTTTGVFNIEGDMDIIDTSSNKGTITSPAVTLDIQTESHVNISNANIISTNQGTNSAIYTKGTLTVDKDTYIEGQYGIGGHDGGALTTVNGARIKANAYNGLQINSNNDAKIIVNDAYIEANLIGIKIQSGALELHAGTIIAKEQAVLSQTTQTIDIIQNSKPLYIKSLAQVWKPAVDNSGTGTMNITASRANACTSNPNDTTSGLCVYAVGTGANNNNTGNGAVRNSTGTINVYGGTYIGGHKGFNNDQASGTINISNVSVTAGRVIYLYNGGTVNICDSTLTSTLSSPIDLEFNKPGTISYSNSAVFTSGNYTPSVTGTGTTTNTGNSCPVTFEAVICDNTNNTLSNCETYSTIDNAIAARNSGTIVLQKDLNRSSAVHIKSGKNFTIDLNGQTIYGSSYGSTDTTEIYWGGGIMNDGGTLVINDSKGTGQILSGVPSQNIRNINGGTLTINGGSYNGRRGLYNQLGTVTINGGDFTTNSVYPVENVSGTMTINGGTFTNTISNKRTIYSSDVLNINGGTFTSVNITIDSRGAGTITGGTFSSSGNSVVYNAGSGTLSIIQTDKPIHIVSTGTTGYSAIYNVSSSTITISAAQTANACTATASATTRGLCAYAVGNATSTNDTGNYAVHNNTTTGSITINGGTYVGGRGGLISQQASGFINARNVNVTAGKPIFVYNGGTVKICNSTVTSTLSTPQDITFNKASGEAKYATNVTFTSGNNTPTISSTKGTVTATGNNTCPIQ